MTYAHDGSETHSDSFDFTVADGNGGAVSDTFYITVDPVNDAPVLSLPGEPLDTNEGVDLAIPMIQVTDADAGLNPVTVTLSSTQTSDLVTLNVSDSIDGTLVMDNGTDQITLFGRLANVNATLATLLYRPVQADAHFTDTLTVLTADGGHSGKGGERTTSGEVGIKVNDVPVLTTAALSLNEGAGATLSGTQIQAADNDNGPDELTYTVLALPAHGSLKKGDTGLAVGDTFTQADVLSGQIAYTHDGGETTADGFTFSLSDGDGGAVDNGMFQIAVQPVNDAPSLQTPVRQTANEGNNLVITGIRISDPDAGDSTMTLSFSIGGDALLHADQFGNLTVSGNETESLQAAGTVAELNNWLSTENSLIFIPAPSAGYFEDTLILTADDGNAENNVTVAQVEVKVNDLPILVNVGMAAPEGGVTTITSAQLLVTDGDNPPADITFTLTSPPAHGVITRDGEPAGTFTQDDVNAGRVSYSHDDSETSQDSFSFTVSDGDGGSIGNTVFTITVTPVNDIPGVSFSSDQPVPMGHIIALDDIPSESFSDEQTVLINKGETLTFPEGIQVTDDDAGAELMTVTLSAGHGILTLDPAGTSGVAGNGSATVILTGTASTINVALVTLTYTPDAAFFGQDEITITVSDGVDASSSSLTVTVNDIPALAENGTLFLDEGMSAAITSGLLEVVDGDGAASDLLFTVVADPLHGQLTFEGNAATTFTQQDINDGLVSYSHDDSETTSDSFTFTVSDGLGGDIGDTVFQITIAPVNDLPAISLPEGQQTHMSIGQALAFPDGIRITDADAGSQPMTLNLSVGKGTLAVSTQQLPVGVSITGNTSALMTIVGSLENIEPVLKTLVYSPDAGYFIDSLSVSADDGQGSSSRSFALKVNSPPVLTAGELEVDEGQTATITPDRLRIEDADNAAAELIYTLLDPTNYGSLTLETPC